ncbi:MAG: AMP-binding protein [Steroidobacteraceae bacterium]|jgi:acyl-CoA synthetase (AMP-forming)/AMP-acid ligase II|nr:AMP-binding protein [Steroidobacteraceae bacterium]
MPSTAQPLLTSVPCRYLLKRHALERAGKTAVIDGVTGEAISYGELHERVMRMAGWLASHGIVTGDRVACLALNSKAYTEFFLALASIGAVLVPLNIRHAASELRFIIEDAGARACFACGQLASLAEAALDGNATVQLKILHGPSREGWTDFSNLTAAGNPARGMEPSVSGESLFMLLYTSGTTGKPKGCMIPQRTWTGYAANMAACFGMGETDVYLAFLPYFHVAGFGTALSQLILGGTIVTAPLADPKLFYRLIAEHRVSIVFLVPGISAAFIADESRAATDTSSLRTFISGAGVEKLELVDAVEAQLGAKYYGIYGQTEAGGKVTWADSRMLRDDPTTYGHVMPFCDYMLADNDDHDVPPGAIGELCVRSSTVMLGYWNHPAATAETLKNDWHHTGDLFVQLANGQVKMVDRKKYLIKTGGENVYPQEVEQVLLRHEAVADAAVIGIPDERWGEAVKAFIVLKPGRELTRAAIADWVGAHIAGYKKPRHVEFVAALPRNASGKVVKADLVTRPVDG